MQKITILRPLIGVLFLFSVKATADPLCLWERFVGGTSYVNANLLRSIESKFYSHLSSVSEDVLYNNLVRLLKCDADPNIKYGDGDDTIKSYAQNANDNAGDTLLHRAVRRGYSKVVMALLSADGIDPNIKDSKGRTALHLAVQLEDPVSVFQLLSSPAVDPNTRDNAGNTALHWGAYFNVSPMVMSLLLDEQRMDLNIKNDAGDTALLFALKRKYGKKIAMTNERVNMFLSAGADVNIQDAKGRTALWISAWFGDSQVVASLVYWNADMMIRDNDGWLPITVADYNGHRKTGDLLRKEYWYVDR